MASNVPDILIEQVVKNLTEVWRHWNKGEPRRKGVYLSREPTPYGWRYFVARVGGSPWAHDGWWIDSADAGRRTPGSWPARWEWMRIEGLEE